MTSLSTLNLQIRGRKFILCLLIGTLLLTGCEGPSTTVPRNASLTVEEEPVQLSAVVPESSAERLAQTVDILFTGTNGISAQADEPEASTDAAVYIVSALRNSSYDVNQTGEIIEAVLGAADEDADLCLMIACYGGSGSGTYASDTAAGAAVLLETAWLLSEFSGDTEIHFVFLPGERSETEYIYTYLTEIFTPDPDRLLGAVVLGGLGLNTADENEFGCIDAKATFMAEQINRVCQADFGKECPCTGSCDGVLNALARNLIPAVVYMQKESVEAGTMLDCPALLNLESLQQSADILSRTLALLLGDSTPSMRARAHFTDAADTAQRRTFSFGKDDPLPFGLSVRELESITGLVGEQTSENTINNGKELIGYRFFMEWFGEDTVIPAEFYYLSDNLLSVRIMACEEGIDCEDISALIEEFYGESPRVYESPYGNVNEWTLSMQRLRITIQPQKEGYELNLEEYDTPISVYPDDSLGYSRLKRLFEQVIPETDREHIRFEAYTDGFGGTLGRLSDDFDDAGSMEWMMGLDLNDALTRSAEFKDYLQSKGELIRLYGEYLADTEPALYYNEYNSRFGGDIEDFAESFRLFSLSDVPVDEAGPAADAVRYFYDFNELVSFRDTVRNIR